LGFICLTIALIGMAVWINIGVNPSDRTTENPQSMVG
jgi:hypothetical protein